MKVVQSELFAPVLEPIVDMRTGKQIGAELLCRARRFPSSAKEWRDWYDKVPGYIEVFLKQNDLEWISINYDTKHLLDSEVIESSAKMKGMPIVIEWTEHRDTYLRTHYLKHEILEAVRNLEQLRDLHGFQIAFDDMGSGDDGLRRFSMLAPDFVKIDGGIFHRARKDKRIRDVLMRHVQMYIGLSQVVIEWVENEEDLKLAMSLGAKLGQGYLWDLTQKS
nr:EAL domain-containing protein [Methylomarinum sp. Ch1-1]MDP4523162.1 EAL domain-containing protein [Methylomarinum sp. Ch1-1]